MPGPPGSGVTSSARRNRTRSIQRLSPVDVPEVSEILCNVSEIGTIVNGTETIPFYPAHLAAVPSGGCTAMHSLPIMKTEVDQAEQSHEYYVS